jgi:type II secretory pathway pseudopilin PulG
MPFRKSVRGENGDTIVEVLIAIAVASLVLVAAYQTTNRNTLSTQDAQERGQALKLVESQIELLRNNKGITGGDCFAVDGTVTAATACKVDAQGTPTTGQPQYTLAISTPDANGTYTVTATWERIYGEGLSTVTMFYRVEA